MSESKEQQHTPTPWKRALKTWDGDAIQTIIGPHGEEVVQEPTEFHAYASGAFVSPDGIPANLDLIVRAVNSHEALVDAARKAVNLMGYLHWNDDPVGRRDKAEVYRELSAALALAEKES